MKKNKKILIVIVMFMGLLVSSNVYALNADDKANLTKPADNKNKAAANQNKVTSPTTPNVNTPTSNTNKGGGFFTPPLGGGTDGGTDLKTIFMNVLDVAQTIMIMASTLYLLYAGFMFVTAKGDPTRLKKAQNALLWGLIGTALILTAEVLAYGIGDTVKEVFKGK